MISKRALPALIALLCLGPSPAASQIACIPPEEPYAYEPPENDPELRDIINDQYQDYVEGIENYINCLEQERVDSMQAAQEVVERWVMYFGDEAVLSYDVRLGPTKRP